MAQVLTYCIVSRKDDNNIFIDISEIEVLVDYAENIRAS